MEIHLYNLPLDNTNNNVFYSSDKRKSYFDLLEEVVDRLYDGNILSVTTLDNRHIKMNDTTMTVVLPFSLETLNRYNYLWLSVPNERYKFYFIDERTSLNVGEKPSTSIKCTLDCFGTYYTEIFYGNYNKDIPCLRKSIQNFAKNTEDSIVINIDFKGKCDTPNGQYQKIPCFHKDDEYRIYDLLFIQLTLDPTKDYWIRRNDPDNPAEYITDKVKNFDSMYGNMTYVFIPYCYFRSDSIEPLHSWLLNYGDTLKGRFLRAPDGAEQLGKLNSLLYGSEVILEAKFTCYPPFKYYYDPSNGGFTIPTNFVNRGKLMLGDNIIVDTDVIACTSISRTYNIYSNFIRTCNTPIYYAYNNGTSYKNIAEIDYDFVSEDNGRILYDEDLHKITASSYNVPYNFLMLSCGSNLIPISKFYARSYFEYKILPTANGIRIEFNLSTRNYPTGDPVHEMNNIVNSIFIDNTNYLTVSYDNLQSFLNNNLNSIRNNTLFTSINTSINAGNALNQIGVGIAQFATTGSPSGISSAIGGKEALVKTGISYANYFATLKAKFQDISNQVSNMTNISNDGVSNFYYTNRVMLFYNIRTPHDSRNTKVLKDVYENGEYIDYIPENYLSFEKSIFNYVATDDCSIPIIPILRHRKTIESAFNSGVRYWNVENMNTTCRYFQTNIINLDSEVL